MSYHQRQMRPFFLADEFNNRILRPFIVTKDQEKSESLNYVFFSDEEWRHVDDTESTKRFGLVDYKTCELSLK